MAENRSGALTASVRFIGLREELALALGQSSRT